MVLRRRPDAPREMTWVVVAVGTVPAALGALPPPRHAPSTRMSWRVERRSLSAAELPRARRARTRPSAPCGCADPTAPALVLGSAQPDDRDVRAGVGDRRRAAAQRRGSGARRARRGALGRRDRPRRRPAVGRRRRPRLPLARRRRGRPRSASSASTADVHQGPLVRTPWSAAVCFAGLGPGEVTHRRPQGRRHLPAPHPRRRPLPVRRPRPLGPVGAARRCSPIDARSATSSPSPPAPASPSTTSSPPSSATCRSRVADRRASLAPDAVDARQGARAQVGR